MNGDLISRQAAIEILEELKDLDYENYVHRRFSILSENQWDAVIANFIELINKAQPEQKTRRWIPSKYTDTILCSECGKCYGDEYRYCPNCGAKMKKESEDYKNNE